MSRAHPHADERRVRDIGTADCPLFQPPPPPIRLEPQSVPSGSSEMGADRARRVQQDECDRILRVLARQREPMSRDELHLVTGIPIASLCGRLGPSGPLQTLGLITPIDRGATSAAGNAVLGYAITEKGKKRLEGAA